MNMGHKMNVKEPLCNCNKKKTPPLTSFSDDRNDVLYANYSKTNTRDPSKPLIENFQLRHSHPMFESNNNTPGQLDRDEYPTLSQAKENSINPLYSLFSYSNFLRNPTVIEPFLDEIPLLDEIPDINKALGITPSNEQTQELENISSVVDSYIDTIGYSSLTSLSSFSDDKTLCNYISKPDDTTSLCNKDIPIGQERELFKTDGNYTVLNDCNDEDQNIVDKYIKGNTPGLTYSDEILMCAELNSNIDDGSIELYELDSYYKKYKKFVVAYNVNNKIYREKNSSEIHKYLTAVEEVCGDEDGFDAYLEKRKTDAGDEVITLASTNLEDELSSFLNSLKELNAQFSLFSPTKTPYKDCFYKDNNNYFIRLPKSKHISNDTSLLETDHIELLKSLNAELLANFVSLIKIYKKTIKFSNELISIDTTIKNSVKSFIKGTDTTDIEYNEIIRKINIELHNN
jgi:hypothetical protein